MKSFRYYFIIVTAMLCGSLISGEITQNLKLSRLPLNNMRQEYASKYMEAVLPLLKNPDLKGGDQNWQNAWKSERFTVTRKQAVNYAHALQGGGEWEQLLPQTLIPRKNTSVKMGYDEKKLYMQIKCSQNQFNELLKRTAKLKRDEAVYTNENLDIHLTANSNSNEYFQIMIDCKGSVYDALKIRNRKVSGTEWNKDFYYHINYGKDFWTLTLALPVTEWGLSLQEGAFIDCNIGRVEIFNKEFSTLSPVDEKFNQADRFCRLWIGRKSFLPGISAMEMKNPLPGQNELLVTVSNPAETAFSGTLKSGNDIRKVSLPRNSKKVYKFIKNAPQPGNFFCQAELFNDRNICIDMTGTDVQILPVMTVNLNTLEYIAGGSPLHAEIKINAPADNSELEIICGNKKEKIPANSQIEFDFHPAGTEQSVFKVTLLKNGKTICSADKKITITEDPFNE